MAEFLIYDQDNWMDVPSKQRLDLTGHENVERKILAESGLTIAQRTKKLALHEMKYTARYHRGDIVEARRDGGSRGKSEEASFIFLQVLDISLEDAKQYAVPDEDLSDPTGRPVIIKMSKYYVNLTGLILDKHKNVSLTSTEFNSRLKVKK